MKKVPLKGASDLPLHEFISNAIERQKRVTGKTQADIAAEVGYDKPNMIAMWKNGSAKVPLDKVPLAAKALGIDPAFLLRMTMAQYWPDMADTIAKVFGTVLTENETALITAVREIMKDEDVPHFTREMKRKLKELLTA